jgi:hypothetical protein
MNVINVPAPPKEAFNKHRRISDLIKAQVKHLKHVEEKMPADVKAALPQHAIVTENDAAMYIAAMTRVLGALGGAVQEAPKWKKKAKVVVMRPAVGLDLAAAVEFEPVPKVEFEPVPKKPRARGKKAAEDGKKSPSRRGRR